MGTLDELRVSGVERNESWIKTKYNNQNNSNTFYSVGDEETSVNQPPVANFTYEPLNPTTLDVIYFNSTSIDSDGIIVNWTWDFDDGTYAYDEFTMHQYEHEGTYTVNLTVRDDDGSTDSIEQFIVVSAPSFSWNATLNFGELGGANDFVRFGEASSASDGQDSYDVPKPGHQPEPYIYAWFDAGLNEPYEKLWEDYRKYPDTLKVWNLSVIFASSPYTDVTISWNSSRFSLSEYSSVLLHDVELGTVVDMLANNSYTYNASNIAARDFEIICRTKMQVTALSSEWNFVSLPFNQTVDKEDFIVRYNGTDYNWTQATTDDNPTGGPIILQYLYNWKRTYPQGYEFTDTLQPGYGYWMYAHHPCELWIAGVGNIGDDDYITDLSVQWNVIGLPDDDSIPKEMLVVRYLGTDYNWTQATTDDNPTGGPIVLQYLYNWKRTYPQGYDFAVTLQLGYAYWMYAYYECTLKREVV